MVFRFLIQGKLAGHPDILEMHFRKMIHTRKCNSGWQIKIQIQFNFPGKILKSETEQVFSQFALSSPLSGLVMSCDEILVKLVDQSQR